MQFLRRWIFTFIGVAAAFLVLGVEKIDGFYLFVPVDKYYVDLLISVLLIVAGILLDSNIRKLEKEREIEKKLRQTNEELDTANRAIRESLANVKILKGLLPICASCKKVRDDKGYWQQVEVYFRDRTDAKFTHWLCPECVIKRSQHPPRR
ncbi:MAG: hypothetical protein NTZ78_15040 [Candidatus Aureabacteria bacterium]|nr:hypothetical protein [Candidatus Auribacterota bacterium]